MAQTRQAVALEVIDVVAVAAAALDASVVVGIARSGLFGAALPRAISPIPQSFAGGRGESWTLVPLLAP